MSSSVMRRESGPKTYASRATTAMSNSVGSAIWRIHRPCTRQTSSNTGLTWSYQRAYESRYAANILPLRDIDSLHELASWSRAPRMHCFAAASPLAPGGHSASTRWLRACATSSIALPSVL